MEGARQKGSGKKQTRIAVLGTGASLNFPETAQNGNAEPEHVLGREQLAAALGCTRVTGPRKYLNQYWPLEMCSWCSARLRAVRQGRVTMRPCDMRRRTAKDQKSYSQHTSTLSCKKLIVCAQPKPKPKPRSHTQPSP